MAVIRMMMILRSSSSSCSRSWIQHNNATQLSYLSTTRASSTGVFLHPRAHTTGVIIPDIPLNSKNKFNDTSIHNTSNKHNLDEKDLRILSLVQPIKAYGKVMPKIANARLARMKTVEGTERDIRGSPWKLNLVCKFVTGMTVPDAMQQLLFCKKQKAPLAWNVIRRTANLANIRYGLIPSQLEVAECYSTHGTPLKRIQFHGRGRMGRKYHRFAHFNLKLREIDWELKVAQAQSLHQKQQWFEKYAMSKQEAVEARKEREELEELERQAKEIEIQKNEKK